MKFYFENLTTDFIRGYVQQKTKILIKLLIFIVFYLVRWYQWLSVVMRKDLEKL